MGATFLSPCLILINYKLKKEDTFIVRLYKLETYLQISTSVCLVVILNCLTGSFCKFQKIKGKDNIVI